MRAGAIIATRPHQNAAMSNAAIRTYGLARSTLIYRARPWRRQRLDRFYRRFIAPGDLVFDIGAHLGDRLAAFARLGARVVAVEPQPTFAAALRRRTVAKPACTWSRPRWRACPARRPY